jgi:hypothetical protein
MQLLNGHLVAHVGHSGVDGGAGHLVVWLQACCLAAIQVG